MMARCSCSSVSRWLILLLLSVVSKHPIQGFVASSPRGGRVRRTAAGIPQMTPTSTLVDDLLDLIGSNRYSKKTPSERQTILELMQQLEERGTKSRYLEDEKYVGDDDASGMLQWDSYELKYFDRSIDGDRGSGKRKTSRGRSLGIRSKILGKLFGLRYSFQHLERPGRAINDVGFRVLGIPACVVAGGNFRRVDDTTLLAIRNEFGTELRNDTTVRIDFEAPKLWLGNAKRFPLILSMGTQAQSPPVTLCTTYLDERIRLALAAKGGRLLFTRGGKTLDNYAQDWRAIEAKQPISGKVVVASMLASVGAAWKWIPSTRTPLLTMVALPTVLVLVQKVKRQLGRKRNNTISE